MLADTPRPDAALTTFVNEATSQDLTRLQRLVGDHYAEMRRVAGRIAAREGNAAPSPTELVHEAYLRLIDQSLVTQRGKSFFLGCFARECRRILVDHARARRVVRRGGRAGHETWKTALGVGEDGDFGLLELNEAVEALGKVNDRMAQIVDMRVFGGLTVRECADVLGIAERTVEKDWTFARTWLRKELC